jgi:hypothetical protein
MAWISIGADQYTATEGRPIVGWPYHGCLPLVLRKYTKRGERDVLHPMWH